MRRLIWYPWRFMASFHYVFDILSKTPQYYVFGIYTSYVLFNLHVVFTFNITVATTTVRYTRFCSNGGATSDAHGTGHAPTLLSRALGGVSSARRRTMFGDAALSRLLFSSLSRLHRDGDKSARGCDGARSGVALQRSSGQDGRGGESG